MNETEKCPHDQMWCSDEGDYAGCNRCGDHMIKGVWENAPTRNPKLIRKLMFKTCLSMATRATLARVLVEHMTAQYCFNDWMANPCYYGSALLNSDLVDDESMLTLADLLAAINK